MSILNLLDTRHVVSFEKIGDSIKVTEECDRYYSEVLSIDQLKELIEELKELCSNES